MANTKLVELVEPTVEDIINTLAKLPNNMKVNIIGENNFYLLVNKDDNICCFDNSDNIY